MVIRGLQHLPITYRASAAAEAPPGGPGTPLGRSAHRNDAVPDHGAVGQLEHAERPPGLTASLHGRARG